VSYNVGTKKFSVSSSGDCSLFPGGSPVDDQASAWVGLGFEPGVEVFLNAGNGHTVTARDTREDHKAWLSLTGTTGTLKAGTGSAAMKGLMASLGIPLADVAFGCVQATDPVPAV
jgi:hypothetical protein